MAKLRPDLFLFRLKIEINRFHTPHGRQTQRSSRTLKRKREEEVEELFQWLMNDTFLDDVFVKIQASAGTVGLVQPVYTKLKSLKIYSEVLIHWKELQSFVQRAANSYIIFIFKTFKNLHPSKILNFNINLTKIIMHDLNIHRANIKHAHFSPDTAGFKVEKKLRKLPLIHVLVEYCNTF